MCLCLFKCKDTEPLNSQSSPIFASFLPFPATDTADPQQHSNCTDRGKPGKSFHILSGQILYTLQTDTIYIYQVKPNITLK